MWRSAAARTSRRSRPAAASSIFSPAPRARAARCRLCDLAGGAETVDQAGLGEVVDAQALAAYRRRLAEIDAELDEADARGDAGGAARADCRRDALLAELSAATGLGGRPRGPAVAPNGRGSRSQGHRDRARCDPQRRPGGRPAPDGLRAHRAAVLLRAGPGRPGRLAVVRPLRSAQEPGRVRARTAPSVTLMMGRMDAHHDRTAAFHQLHTAGCFVMPNPWDVGSARALEQLGFKAWPRPVPAWPGRRDARTTR